MFCLLVALDFLLLWLLEFVVPTERVDIARDWPKKKRISDGEGGNGEGRTRGKGGGNNGNVRGGGGRKADVGFAESKSNGIAK